MPPNLITNINNPFPGKIINNLNLSDNIINNNLQKSCCRRCLNKTNGCCLCWGKLDKCRCCQQEEYKRNLCNRRAENFQIAYNQNNQNNQTQKKIILEMPLLPENLNYIHNYLPPPESHNYLPDNQNN